MTPGGDGAHRRALARSDVQPGVEVAVPPAAVPQRRLELEVGRAEALADGTIQWPDDRRGVAVALRPGQHQIDVGVGMVVGGQGTPPVVGSAEVAQIGGGGRDGVGGVADVGVAQPGPLRCLGEAGRQKLQRTAGTGLVGPAVGGQPPVVALDAPDRGEQRPIEAESAPRVLVQHQVVGRDVGHRCDRLGQPRARQAAPVAGQHADRAGQDGQRDEQQRAAAQAAAARAAPHEVSGVGSLKAGWIRSAGRVVSTAYSRRLTVASKAAWLPPTNRRPSPGRAWSRARRSAGVRSK